MNNQKPVLFFRRTTKSGNVCRFAALSEEDMRPLDEANGFISAETITEEQCLSELDPSVGPMIIGMICDDLRAGNITGPELIPEYDERSVLTPVVWPDIWSGFFLPKF
mgnify:CR=1 FL=1